MKEITLKYVADAMYGSYYEGDPDSAVIDNVVIDSRNAGSDSLFFCIIGARNDAHKFLYDVRKAGCRNVVISDDSWAARMKECGDMNFIRVKDTTRALIDLASQYMEDWPELKKVGVTGSVGKTSTKEFIYKVLSCRFRTGKTQGNLNSCYGVPLTVFSLDRSCEAAVIEMGVGDGSEMKDLAHIVKPDAAAVTMIGSSHLETYGTRENIREEKLRIADGFTNDNPLIINTDNDMLQVSDVRKTVNGDPHIITVGSKGHNNYMLSNVCDSGIDGVKCTLDVKTPDRNLCGRFELSVPVMGAHNLWNAAEAIAVGGAFGIPTADAVKAVSQVDPHVNGNRLDLRRGGDFTVINDTYNASPESMKAGINVLMNSSADRHIAVLGDMFELGEDSDNLHRSVGVYAAENGVEVLITIGKNARWIGRGAEESGMKNVFSFDSREEAENFLKRNIRRGDLILVKASRGMALEQLVDAITSERKIKE